MSYDPNQEPAPDPNTPPPGDPYTLPDSGFYGSPVTSLPLGKAIQQLPGQYVNVLTRPAAATFAEEIGKARWDVFWTQLLSITILSIAFALLETPLIPTVLQNSMQSSLSGPNPLHPATVQLIEGFTRNLNFASVILVPVFFFIGQGFYYLLARAFRGTGSFLAQCYTTLLFQTPLTIVGFVLGLLTLVLTIAASPVRYIGSLFSSALGIYTIVLQIFAIMAVHRLSGGRATATVLIPYGVLLLFSCILGIVLVVLIVSTLQMPH